MHISPRARLFYRSFLSWTKYNWVIPAVEMPWNQIFRLPPDARKIIELKRVQSILSRRTKHDKPAAIGLNAFLPSTSLAKTGRGQKIMGWAGQKMLSEEIFAKMFQSPVKLKFQSKWVMLFQLELNLTDVELETFIFRFYPSFPPFIEPHMSHISSFVPIN